METIIKIAIGIFLAIWGIIWFLALSLKVYHTPEDITRTKARINALLSIAMFATGIALQHSVFVR